jgi:hypothetical protein
MPDILPLKTWHFVAPLQSSASDFVGDFSPYNLRTGKINVLSVTCEAKNMTTIEQMKYDQ